MILVDAGPLVALVHREDTHHQRCAATLRRLRDRLGTTWPVMTEAMHLLSFSWQAQDALWEMNALQVLHILPLDSADLPRIRQLMQKHRDLPMDLADATLVRVAEREAIRRVFTIDRRDFARYRPAKIGRFQIIP
jgi:predicted nucleic acid-binding protein